MKILPGLLPACFAAILIAAAGAQNALGTTNTVTSLSDSGVGSLRDVIAASAGGDMIVFSVTGTIALGSELNIDKPLTIRGPGPMVLTISGDHATRLFIVGAPAKRRSLTLRSATGRPVPGNTEAPFTMPAT